MIPLPSVTALRHRLLAALALCALLPVSTLRAYDPPNFTADLFSRDGIFLADDETSSLLEALAAIASNFSGNSRVDDDLREKALVLALHLDPLHFHSRAAHRELSIGAKPKATSFFDSLSSVSETLWSTGKRLAEPPLDPEEIRLAPYLLELSLLVHPEPPGDRLSEFARIAGGKAVSWEGALRLRREANASSARARDLFSEALKLNGERDKDPKVAASPPPTSKDPNEAPLPDPNRPPRPPRPPLESIEPVVVSLATVRQVTAIDTASLPGTVTLTLRSPKGGLERDFLDERLAAAVPFPILASDEGIPLVGLDLPAGAASGRSWVWPAEAVGELRFDPVAPSPGPRRLLSASALLPELVLVEAALSKRPINESFVLLGGIDSESLVPTIPEDPVAAIEAALTMDRPYLLVPDAILEPLVAYLLKSERLELLFKSEFVGYKDLAGAISRLTSPTDPALIAASGTFSEIEGASARLPLPDLARNSAAQEKLKGLLTTVPDHLSARAMLDFGLQPVTAEMRLAHFAAKIDEAAAPFLTLGQPDEDLAGLAGMIEGTKSQFLRLRAEVPTEARDLLAATEDLVDAAGLYLEITNKGSSMGIERLRETGEAIAAYRSEWSKLGLDPANE